jgi:hypothetical protein
MADESDLLQHLIAHGSLSGGEPRRPEYTGTKALMLAVLEEGIRNYCSGAERLRADAEAWIHSDRYAPFSFVVICETLGLEPGPVRLALRRLQDHSGPRRARIRPNGRRLSRK